MSPSSSILIKGYLPLRITLPFSFSSASDDDKNEVEHTFLYLKEHIVTAGSSNASGSDGGSSTLFVVNVPFVPNIRTKLFLHSLFDRYGDVDRVVVVKDPRSSSTENDGNEDDSDAAGLWRDQFQRAVAASDDNGYFSYKEIEDANDEGKFAHVVFASPKEMKKALKRMTNLMMTGDTEDDKKKKKKKKILSASSTGSLPSISFGKLELQELEDESKRLRKKELARKKANDDDDDDVDFDEEGNESSDDNSSSDDKNLTGIQALLKLQRQNIIPRSKLMEACNTIMSNFEQAEEDAEKQRIANASQPDEDGFITVSNSNNPAPSSSQVGNKRQLEKDGGMIRRQGGSKRSRKQKESLGASQLKDFYKFQMKETRKKGLEDLKKRFEEDLKKVKKMKEQKQYRPF